MVSGTREGVKLVASKERWLGGIEGGMLGWKRRRILEVNWGRELEYNRVRDEVDMIEGRVGWMGWGGKRGGWK